MQNVDVIFGAPGCGKTTYLLNVLEEELKVHSPEKIAFVSFTKKGATEGLTRAVDKFDYDKKRFKYFRTLHSICFTELNMSRYDMLSKKDYKIFSNAMNMKFVGYYTEEFYHNDDRYLYLYFLKLNNYNMYLAMRDSIEQDVKKIKHVAINYERYKKHFNKVDFTDLLLETIKREIHLDVEVAIIDEAQDLTTLQWQVCETLFKNASKVYIAGDDDQAIYEWTGADVTYFLGIDGKRTVLDKSWRLKSNLLDFAKLISSRIQQRVDKNFDPADMGGNVNFYNTLEEIEFNNYETYYCLSRNNYFLRKFTTLLKQRSLLFMYKNNPSVNPDVIAAINLYKRYKTDKESLKPSEELKVRKMLRKDITTLEHLEWFEAFDMSIDDAFYYRSLIMNKVKIVEPKIVVNTIHGVKGGEADNVILLLDVTKTVYKQIHNLSDSELRCLYVACTRAKTNLNIIFAASKFSYEKIIKELTDECNL